MIWLKKAILSYMPVLVTSTFPCMFLLLNNISEVSFDDIITPITVMFWLGFGTYVVCAVALKSFRKSTFCASVVSLVFTNYKYIQDLFVQFFSATRYWHFAGIMVFVVLWLFYVYGKYASKDIVSTVNQVLMIVFAGLILINAVTAAPSIVQRIKSASVKNSKAQYVVNKQNSSEEPNFYHFVMDEFSSREVMETYYDYDSLWFFDWLNEKGFSVGKNNRNETIDTITILTNMINLDYIVNNGTPASERDRIRKDAVLPKYLAKQGYDLVGLGSTYNEFNIGDEVSRAKAMTVGGKSFDYLFFENSLIYPFISSVNIEERNKILNAFEWFENPDNYNDKGRYVLTYLLLPHEPFFFDENGGFVDEINHNNWKDKQYYLGQYIFCCKMLKQAIENILENDPDAVIMINSDHSARAADDYELYLKWIGLHDARRCVNAVYYRGEEFGNIDEISSLNTLRAVLTRLFETDEFPPLEEPDYYNWQGGVFE